MTRLTVERLFANPPLSGTLPTQLKFSPDGRYVTWLKPGEDDRERLDLWRMELATGSQGCWLNAKALIDADAVLSDAEKAERERRRLFARGITAYHISPDGALLLIPVDGVGYFFHAADGTLTRFTPEGTRQTDFRFSPKGTYVSYVRAGNLYYRTVPDGPEIAVTTDGGGLISNGIADFIAQEEMHRYDGHWWSPDESRIAFTRTDESTVAVSRRYEIDADEFNVIEQRYPYAGAGNAAVTLQVVELASGTAQPVPWQHAPDDYLARIGWAGERLAVQVQSRDQHTLHLDFHRPGHPGRQTVLTERSDTWVNLHDNFQALDGDRFLWTSERDGTSQLYLYSNGEPTRLTAGPGRVTAVLHADERRVLYSGWQASPTEQHLFEVPLAGGEPVRLTQSAGWHDVVVDKSGERYIDRWTSLDNPGEIRVRSILEAPDAVLASEQDDPAHPYRPYLDSHATPVLGTLTAEDGQTLHYRLTRPAGAGVERPAALIVHVYGGPGVHRVKNEWAPLVLQLFAARGFGVLELDNRGSSNRGRDFEAPIYRRLGDVEVRDQLLGARFAQSLDWVDGARIGVFGHSYGGYMTLMCLAQAPDVFKAGVAVAPVSEWALYDTHYTERYLGTPQDNPQGYRDSAVFAHLDGLEGKLLIMHGMADDNVLFTHSTKLFKALQGRCYPFEMMTYPGSKHALQEREVSIHRYNMILDFFERSLPT
ncbi:MAG: alpha/beta fold hydrolase [Pseudomonadales bacterium]